MLSAASRRWCSAAAIGQQRVAVIGAGKMAEAMMRAMAKRVQVTVFDPNDCRVELFSREYGAARATSLAARGRRGRQISEVLADAVRTADVVLLSCKPQNLEAVFEGSRGHLDPTSLVLSIVAGCSIKTLEQGFSHDRIVRSMPNTPSSVGEGMTVWTGTASLSEAQRAFANEMLSSLGDAAFVHEESFLDMATALSGSGPAYVLLLAESMIETGVHLGFPRELSSRLAVQTLKGTAEYLRQSGKDATTLRNDITSPGGTTAAAMYHLEKGNFRTVVADGIWAAYRRSLELGKIDSNVGPGRSHSKLPGPD